MFAERVIKKSLFDLFIENVYSYHSPSFSRVLFTVQNTQIGNENAGRIKHKDLT
jgi:hypothetical protein